MMLQGVSDLLTERLGKGWSTETLKVCRRFYQIYSAKAICYTPSSKLPAEDLVDTVYQIQKSATLSQKSDAPYPFTLCRTMNVREHIVNKLIAAGGFWSYDEKSVRENMSDDQLIEAVLEKLDIDDIDLLFQIFPKNKIKAVWRERMVIQNDFYYSLNRFFAWYYFGIRRPDRYLKAMNTRHLSKLTA